VRAATLLSKVFLHYLAMLSETDVLLDLWLKIITIMDRLMNSGQGDNLVCPPPCCSPNYLLTAQ
jgi:brefeldin A-resistance guanine nucleotide exchange factor 1